MTDSLKAAADTVAEVARQVDGDPYSIKVVGWLVLTLTAIFAFKFAAECIIKKKFVLGAGTSLYAHDYRPILEVLWALTAITTGIIIRVLIADGTNDKAAHILFVGIGLLSAASVGFFVSEYLTVVYKGSLNKPLYYINKTIAEWTWVCWLVYSGGSFISNFVNLGDEFEPLTWKDCFTFTFILPIAVFILKVSLIAIKYRSLKSHNR